MNKIVLLLLLTASLSFAQNKTVWNNYKNKVDNKKEYKNINDSSNSKLKTSTIDSLEKGFSLKKGFSLNLGIGYLIPIGEDLDGGFTIVPSLRLNTSKNISWYSEFSFSRHWYDHKFAGFGGNTYYVYLMLINLGLRIYPENKDGFYYKPGIGIDFSFTEKSPGPGYFYSLNLGIGNDFKINKNIELYAEGEILFHPPIPFLLWHSIFDLNFTAGLKYKL